jgi:hypothetical protein
MKNFNAVRYIYPNAEFSMINDDVSMITWVGEDILDKEEAKNSALNKLQALGLTEAEAKAIAGV